MILDAKIDSNNIYIFIVILRLRTDFKSEWVNAEKQQLILLSYPN